MRKMNKIINIVLIFIITVGTLLGDLAHAGEGVCLRVPLVVSEGHFKADYAYEYICAFAKTELGDEHIYNFLYYFIFGCFGVRRRIDEFIVREEEPEIVNRLRAAGTREEILDIAREVIDQLSAKIGRVEFELKRHGGDLYIACSTRDGHFYASIDENFLMKRRNEQTWYSPAMDNDDASKVSKISLKIPLVFIRDIDADRIAEKMMYIKNKDLYRNLFREYIGITVILKALEIGEGFNKDLDFVSRFLAAALEKIQEDSAIKIPDIAGVMGMKPIEVDEGFQAIFRRWDKKDKYDINIFLTSLCKDSVMGRKFVDDIGIRDLDKLSESLSSFLDRRILISYVIHVELMKKLGIKVARTAREDMVTAAIELARKEKYRKITRSDILSCIGRGFDKLQYRIKKGPCVDIFSASEEEDMAFQGEFLKIRSYLILKGTIPNGESAQDEDKKDKHEISAELSRDYSYFLKFAETHLRDYKKYPEEFVFLWSVFQIWIKKHKIREDDPVISWLKNLEDPEKVLNVAGNMLESVCVKNGATKVEFQYKRVHHHKHIRIDFVSSDIDISCTFHPDKGLLELDSVLRIKGGKFFAWSQDKDELDLFPEYIADAEDHESEERIAETKGTKDYEREKRVAAIKGVELLSGEAKPDLLLIGMLGKSKGDVLIVHPKIDEGGRERVSSRLKKSIDLFQQFVDLLDSKERASFYTIWLLFIKKQEAVTDVRLALLEKKIKEEVFRDQNLEILRSLIKKHENFTSGKLANADGKMFMLADMIDFLKLIINGTDIQSFPGENVAVTEKKDNEQKTVLNQRLEERYIQRVVVEDARRRLVQWNEERDIEGVKLAVRVIRILDPDNSALAEFSGLVSEEATNNKNAAGLLGRINPDCKIGEDELLRALVQLLRYRNDPLVKKYENIFGYYHVLSLKEYRSHDNASNIRWLCSIMLSFLDGQVRVDGVSGIVLEAIRKSSPRDQI